MTAWDISTAVFQNSKQVVTSSTHSPTGLFIRSDGLKMYVINNSRVNDGNPANTNQILEFNLSTAWNITTASLVQSFNVTPNTVDPKGIFFRPDGTRMFLVKGEPPVRIHQYNLSTPWNISTAIFNITSIELPAPTPVVFPQDIFFRSDGLKLYITNTDDDEILEYNLSVPWDVTNPSLSFVQSKSVVAQDTVPTGIFFKPDGLKMYITGGQNRNIYEYNLSTAWNISTATFFQSKNISTEDTLPISLFFKPDGLNIFTTGDTNGRVYSYDLSEAPPPPCLPPCIFCDDISTNTGWVRTGPIVNSMILIDDPSFPDTMRLNSLNGNNWAYKDIGGAISGNNIKFQFKLDYESRVTVTGFSPRISVAFGSSTGHPQTQTGSIIRVDVDISKQPYSVLNGIVSDGITTINTVSGASNQHALWIYPNNNVPASNDSLKGPYYVTVELKDNKLRLSMYIDSARTQHMRGSPITVDAIGMNLTNLRYVLVSGGFNAGSGRAFTGFIDDICVFQNSGGLSIIPQKFIPATGSFIETWDGYATGDQNPTPWISRNEVIGGPVTLLTDIHEVSTINPIEGTKAFKINHKFSRIGNGPREGRESVSRFVPAVVRTDGSGLDIPLSLTAKMRADILSLASDPIGVMVGYELLLGAPSVPTPTRGIFFKLYGNNSSTVAYIWDGTQWISNNPLDAPISQSNPVGSIQEISVFNLKNEFDSSVQSELLGWDFESHVSGIWVGYVGVNIAGANFNPTEVLINGDTISMLNAGVTIKTFPVGAIIKGVTPKEFKVSAKLIKRKEFTINAHIPPIPKKPKVNARLVRRNAVNSTYVNAILFGTVTITTQTKTFLINAIIQQPLYKTPLVNAILIKRKEKTTSINAILVPLSKTFKIDALVGIFEPMSILDVESVIGHEV